MVNMVIRVVEISSGGTKLERFLPKKSTLPKGSDQILRIGLINREASKSALIRLSKSILYLKRHRNLSQHSFSLNNINLHRSTLLTFFDNF